MEFPRSRFCVKQTRAHPHAYLVFRVYRVDIHIYIYIYIYIFVSLSLYLFVYLYLYFYIQIVHAFVYMHMCWAVGFLGGEEGVARFSPAENAGFLSTRFGYTARCDGSLAYGTVAYAGDATQVRVWG